MTSPASRCCARCGELGTERGRHWPEGDLCQKCAQRALRVHGVCADCGVSRLTPGLNADGRPTCVDCAGIATDFHCKRCGEEDEPVRAGLCAACCLRDDLEQLLDDGTGRVKPQLRPLLEALATQKNPRSARVWLTVNPESTQLLREIARGTAPLEHATFVDHESPSRVKYLPDYDRDIAAYEEWLERKLSPALAIEDRQLIQQYATWVHLKRMRYLADQGRLRPATILAARQSTNVGLQFLLFLRERDIPVARCSQQDIDDWLSGGPTTRSLARGFARWAMAHNHLPKLNFPYRVAATFPIIGQQERIDVLRQVLDTASELRSHVRVATILLLLFAQPLSRVVEMKSDQLVVGDDGTVQLIDIGIDPLVVMAPFDRVFLDLMAARPNMNTAGNPTSQWLFPGGSPGRHLTASALMNNIRDAGIDLRGAKNAALRKLVLAMPAALVADAFGYSYERAEIHSRSAGKQFADYAGLAVERAEDR
jgi:hypothetical protein